MGGINLRVVDCHVHIHGEVDVADLLGCMDANGVDRILAISMCERESLAQTRTNLLAAKKLFDAAPDRIRGLAWINPALDGAGDLAEQALTEMGYSGLKIIPDHYHVYEQRFEPFWERMNELGASILFHTGILYAFEDASRFCRPLYLEKLLHYPRIRFAMAHISWPWCEECLAVMGRMRAAAHYGDGWQSYIDITPGTPPHIRKETLANALSFCGPERMMFGTDSAIPSDLGGQRTAVARDTALLRDIGLDESGIERVMSGTADELFPPAA